MPPQTRSASLYTFPSDLVDDGVARVIDDARSGGFDTLAVALAYHQARDVVPHPRGPRLRYRRDGVFFEPDDEKWADSPMRPSVQSAEERAAVAELLAAPDRPAVESWTVFLHNTGLGEQHPSAATENCFGDRILSNLCPATPLARAYALALADDVSSRGLDVVAEALSQQTFGHGHHHERSFAPVSAGDETLLSLCFCGACADRAGDVDTEALAARCRERVDAAWAGAAALPATRDALVDAIGDDLLAYLAARERAVTEIAGEVAAIVRSRGQRLVFMDLTGAVLGYDDGRPQGALAADQAWRLAIDPAAVASGVDAYAVLGYAQDPARLHDDVASVRAAIGEGELRVILRPGHPDTTSASHWREKEAAAIAAGADRVDAYNYGMAPEHVLARLERA